MQNTRSTALLSWNLCFGKSKHLFDFSSNWGAFYTCKNSTQPLSDPRANDPAAYL